MGYGDRSGGRPDRVDAGYDLVKLNEEAAPVPKVERESGTRSKYAILDRMYGWE